MRKRKKAVIFKDDRVESGDCSVVEIILVAY